LADDAIEIDGHSWEQCRVASDFDIVSNVYMGVYFAVILNNYLFVYIGEGADIDIFSNFSCRMDEDGIFDAGFVQAYLIVDFQQHGKCRISIFYPNYGTCHGLV